MRLFLATVAIAFTAVPAVALADPVQPPAKFDLICKGTLVRSNYRYVLSRESVSVRIRFDLGARELCIDGCLGVASFKASGHWRIPYHYEPPTQLDGPLYPKGLDPGNYALDNQPGSSAISDDVAIDLWNLEFKRDYHYTACESCIVATDVHDRYFAHCEYAPFTGFHD